MTKLIVAFRNFANAIRQSGRKEGIITDRKMREMNRKKKEMEAKKKGIGKWKVKYFVRQL